MSESRQESGKSSLDAMAADTNLFDDDLIEMTNAGLIPATVTRSERG